MSATSTDPLPLLVVQPVDPRWPGVVLPVGCVDGWLIVKLTLTASEGDSAPTRAQEPLDMEAPASGSPPEPGAPVLVPGVGAVRYPRVRPVAACTDPELAQFEDVALRFEALAIDDARLTLLWRGELPERAPGSRMRVFVALAEDDDDVPWADRLGDLALAHLGWALAPGAPAGDDEELALERYALQERVPEPSLSIERYAAIAAELAEGLPRATVLSRAGLDEGSWLVEERGWLERMAEAAMGGDSSVAERYGAAFVAAQDALEPPEELDAMLHDYVALSVRLERAEDPGPVFERWAVTLAQWMRLERHWQRRGGEEPRVAAELARLLSEERARLQAEAEPA